MSRCGCRSWSRGSCPIRCCWPRSSRLATLNQNSEVIAMKAAGMSAHQVLAPLILTAAVVACVSFAFNERVVTRATATLTGLEGGRLRPDSQGFGRSQQRLLCRWFEYSDCGIADRKGQRCRDERRDLLPPRCARDDQRTGPQPRARPMPPRAGGLSSQLVSTCRPPKPTSSAPIVVAKGITPDQVAMSGSMRCAERVRAAPLDRPAKGRWTPHGRAGGQVVAQVLRAALGRR